ncbi:MAG: tRNA 2-thiouridine(34) synthase MnmA, partial [Patescibacteria group bacterium]
MKSQVKSKVFAAMSGGVDSSVAAALLKKQGWDVVGVYMKCWSAWDQCSVERDAEDARAVAEKLDIPFYIFDFEREYRERVFDVM